MKLKNVKWNSRLLSFFVCFLCCIDYKKRSNGYKVNSQGSFLQFIEALKVVKRNILSFFVFPFPFPFSFFLSFFPSSYFVIYCIKRRARQGSNLQSPDPQSDAFPLRHRPYKCIGDGHIITACFMKVNCLQSTLYCWCEHTQHNCYVLLLSKGQDYPSFMGINQVQSDYVSKMQCYTVDDNSSYLFVYYSFNWNFQK